MQKVRSKRFPDDCFRYGAGEIIIKEGQGSSVIYILSKGKLGVYKGAKKVSEITGEGTIFGEMSSILGKPRTCTVKAESESEVIVYRGGIDGIMVKFPSITKKVMRLLAERLHVIDSDYSQLKVNFEDLKEQLEKTSMQLERALNELDKHEKSVEVKTSETGETETIEKQIDKTFQAKISKEELDALVSKDVFRKGWTSSKVK